jgi:hypothetical protein
MWAWLYSLDTLVIVGLLFLGFILTWEIAFRFGRRLANQRGKDSETQSQSIEASVLTCDRDSLSSRLCFREPAKASSSAGFAPVSGCSNRTLPVGPSRN